MSRSRLTQLALVNSAGLFPCLIAAMILSVCSLITEAQQQEEKKTPTDKLIADQSEFANQNRWIYNDLDRAVKQSKTSGKPLLVVFRCVPCEACSHFDRQVIEPDRATSQLLDRFECVRITQANGLDLGLFQFDWDQSFHVIFMDSNKHILGRFGTRSFRPEDEDMTITGFQATMKAVLSLASEPDQGLIRSLTEGKKAPTQPEFKRPELMPTLIGTYTSTLAKSGNIARSCIHCHQIRDAQRNLTRKNGEDFDSKNLFPYPLPDTIGIRLSPDHESTVLQIEKDSLADQAGLSPGDEILTANGQRLLSPADFQWVLHNANDGDELRLTFQRGQKAESVSINLKPGWREKSDLSWRPTSWNFRRMTTGGLRLQGLTAEEQKSVGIDSGKMALRVNHVGQYGEHAAAKKAGFQVGDIIVSVDGRSDLMRETDLFAYGVKRRKGEKLDVEVIRKGKPVTLKLPMQ
jgi:thioredoxin-related protein